MQLCAGAVCPSGGHAVVFVLMDLHGLPLFFSLRGQFTACNPQVGAGE